jgi:hypothetical protein
MGMDIYGLNPRLKSIKPKFPDNYEELSDKQQRAYWDEKDEFIINNPGYYFSASNWSWRPIVQLCIYAIENSKLNTKMIDWTLLISKNWHNNDGHGLKNQEECDFLASSIKHIIKEEDNLEEDDDMVYVNYGSWNKLGSKNVSEKEKEKLNLIYPYGTIMFRPFIDDNGNIWEPNHKASLNRIKTFIIFLRNCGGFKIL